MCRTNDSMSAGGKPSTGKRRVLSTGIVGLIILGVFWWALWRREPRHEGRPLSYWLDEMNKASSLEECEPALQAIKAMGPDALPFLLSNIRGGPPAKWETRLYDLTERSEAFARIVPMRVLNLSPTCLALSELGTNAAPIIPELERLFLESDLGGWPAYAILSIGSNAAPAFVKGCESTNEETRVNSGLYLAKTIDGRKDWWSWGWATSPKGRRQLSLGFTTMNGGDARALVRHLRHANAAVRRASAEALKQYKGSDVSVLNALISASQDEDPDVRRAAMDSISILERAK